MFPQEPKYPNNYGFHYNCHKRIEHLLLFLLSERPPGRAPSNAGRAFDVDSRSLGQNSRNP